MSRDFHRLHVLIASDPKAAFPALVAFIEAEPPHLEAVDLLEDLVGRADEALVCDVETEAAGNDRFAYVVANAYVGDVSGVAADQFRRLQYEVRGRFPDISHWEGWLPINPRDIPER